MLKNRSLLSRADTASDDITRLREFWNTRYQAFSLSESGWSGAGDEFNHYVYRCKSAAVTRALRHRGYSDGATFAVLDAGCGQGYFADFYADRYPNANYVGLDLSRRVIAHLRRTRPSVEVHECDFSSWTPEPFRRFDVIQCLEVLHLILDDDVVQRAFLNFGRLVRTAGVVLVTMRPGDEDVSASSYLRYRPEAQIREWWEAAGLVEHKRIPMYYWMPDQGPRWRATRPLFFRMPAAGIFAMDRIASALRLPRVATGPDSQTELIILTRAGAA
jgi:SAM-dependent methyltransferase